MALYAFTIFLSAFLLFLVQPIIAKQILPWFGGSAAVWTTCLVFFQAALLAGYAYADWLVRRVAAGRALWLHVALLVSAVALLPIVPAAHWKPNGGENPSWLILGLLAATIGLPYFMLSTTSPLLQAWFARRHPGRSPYRLFALSNAASMLALVGYPFVVEPWIATRAQAIAWSTAFAAFAVALCRRGVDHAACTRVRRHPGYRWWCRRPRRRAASHRRRPRANGCGWLSPPPVPCCCWPSPAISPRTSPRCPCCGCCR